MSYTQEFDPLSHSEYKEAKNPLLARKIYEGRMAFLSMFGFDSEHLPSQLTKEKERRIAYKIYQGIKSFRQLQQTFQLSVEEINNYLQKNKANTDVTYLSQLSGKTIELKDIVFDSRCDSYIDGMEAEHSMVMNNLKLVKKMATDNGIKQNMDIYDDAMQGGYFGLCLAVRYFNPDYKENNKFSTYAGELIRVYMHRAIRKCTMLIHIPEPVSRQSKRLEEYETNFFSGKRTITIQEYRQFLEQLIQNKLIKDPKVKFSETSDKPDWLKYRRYTIAYRNYRKVKKVAVVSEPPLSLDMEVTEEPERKTDFVDYETAIEDGSLIDGLIDPEGDSAYSDIENRDVISAIVNARKDIPEEVFTIYYLFHTHEYSISELARMYNKTYYLIKLIINKTHNRLVRNIGLLGRTL